MRAMAIDYGDAHTGVALSDLTGTLVGDTSIIDSWNQDKVMEGLTRFIRDYQVTELVLGFPKNMNNTCGERVEKSKTLAERLRMETGLPVKLWDERLTTVDAHRILSANGKKNKKHKQYIDAVAATLILEGYLTWRRNHTPEE